MMKALSSIGIFAVLCVVGQSPAKSAATAAHSSPSAYIESATLRIEFDKEMRSRVIARFDGKEAPIGSFSASETIKGDERSWYNFALTSQTRQRIADAYGA